jgi:hypothetical protein
LSTTLACAEIVPLVLYMRAVGTRWLPLIRTAALDPNTRHRRHFVYAHAEGHVDWLVAMVC